MSQTRTALGHAEAGAAHRFAADVKDTCTPALGSRAKRRACDEESRAAQSTQGSVPQTPARRILTARHAAKSNSGCRAETPAKAVRNLRPPVPAGAGPGLGERRLRGEKEKL